MSNIHKDRDLKCICDICFKVSIPSRDSSFIRLSTFTVKCALQVFNTERFLKVHIQRVHQNVKRYFCEVCNKGFFEKYRMLQHRTVHGTEEEKQALNKWPCSYCQRSFRTKACLQQHMNNHTGAKPYTCSYCSRSFAWASEGGILDLKFTA